MRRAVRQFFLTRPLWLSIPVLMAFSVAASVGALFLLTELMGLGYPPSFRRSLMVATIAPMLVSGPIGGFIVHLLREVDGAHRRVQHLAWHDELTGLLNRRRFTELGQQALERGLQQGEAVTAVLLDVDDFKQVNDRHGHAAGDAVLQTLGHVLTVSLRRSDLSARWGGEEFALVLPGAGREDAAGIVERLRQAVASTPIVAAGQSLRCTVSIGVAPLRPGDSFDALIRRADDAMYRAKTSGKNRVCLAEAA
ncbi:GGDEF domain-containing protein [Ideonella sp. 4Y11]|uniref:diguanylate cyclase n=1 Tax=Ideonella aquatica TaxID=2824119 RepID=A0A941BL49_9BURK|nr:GGDEF domain-containing protein [Ideonella aquatica]MBQ0960583.1 GGDEF domain-containing protein [Ideonella aquatica]